MRLARGVTGASGQCQAGACTTYRQSQAGRTVDRVDSEQALSLENKGGGLNLLEWGTW